MIDKGHGYWATGITVCWQPGSSVRGGVRHDGWTARAEFFDGGFCDDDADLHRVSTEGVLHTRYAVPDGDTVTGLRAAIDTIVADAQRLGITFRRPVDDDRPALYYKGDGEDPEWPAPDGWEQMLAAEAERIEWRTYSSVSARS